MPDRNDFLKIDSLSFEKAFKEYYAPLFQQAFRFVQRTDIAEELVQEVFVQLWEKRHQIKIKSSLKSYLYTAVKNQCLNYLKQEWHKREVPLEVVAQNIPDQQEEDTTLHLQRILQIAIQQLPPKCRIIFQLSRQAGLSYDEIAEELDISKETVKTQIKIAYQKLRVFLKEQNSEKN